MGTIARGLPQGMMCPAQNVRRAGLARAVRTALSTQEDEGHDESIAVARAWSPARRAVRRGPLACRRHRLLRWYPLAEGDGADRRLGGVLAVRHGRLRHRGALA